MLPDVYGSNILQEFEIVRSSLGQLPVSISLQVWVSLYHFCGQSKHIGNLEDAFY